MSEALDRLLSRPLEEPADAGFSARVLVRAHQINARRAYLENTALIAAAACVVALLPFTNAGWMVAHAAANLALSGPLVLGLMALVGSSLWLQPSPE
jgi:hypothetical protein